jgi:hypothetical protein
MKNIFLFIVLGLFTIGCDDSANGIYGPAWDGEEEWRCDSTGYSTESEWACEEFYGCPEECYCWLGCDD